jgi:hypothetical protein
MAAELYLMADPAHSHDKGQGELVPAHAMEACRWPEVQFHSFLTSTLDDSEWSTLLPGRFTPGKEPRYPLNSHVCKLHNILHS